VGNSRAAKELTETHKKTEDTQNTKAGTEIQTTGAKTSRTPEGKLESPATR